MVLELRLFSIACSIGGPEWSGGILLHTYVYTYVKQHICSYKSYEPKQRFGLPRLPAKPKTCTPQIRLGPYGSKHQYDDHSGSLDGWGGDWPRLLAVHPESRMEYCSPFADMSFFVTDYDIRPNKERTFEALGNPSAAVTPALHRYQG